MEQYEQQSNNFMFYCHILSLFMNNVRC